MRVESLLRFHQVSDKQCNSLPVYLGLTIRNCAIIIQWSLSWGKYIFENLIEIVSLCYISIYRCWVMILLCLVVLLQISLKLYRFHRFSFLKMINLIEILLSILICFLLCFNPVRDCWT